MLKISTIKFIKHITNEKNFCTRFIIFLNNIIYSPCIFFYYPRRYSKPQPSAYLLVRRRTLYPVELRGLFYFFVLVFVISPHAELNHGPFAYKASALPLSYEGFLSATGIEPATNRFQILLQSVALPTELC